MRFELFGGLFGNRVEKEEEENSQVDSGKEEEVMEEESPEAEPKPSLNLEEEFTQLEEKKEEIEELIEKRHDHYINAKTLEEKMENIGLAEEKKKEIKRSILENAGEITEKINKIRAEFGIEPTPVEIYATRAKMLSQEISRIMENRAPGYRKIKEKIQNAYGTAENMIKKRVEADPRNFEYFLKDLKEYSELEGVGDFIEKVDTLDPYKDGAEIGNHVSELKETMDEKIKEKTLYKTPAKDQEMLDKVNRLVRLLADTEITLHNAERKEGRFAEKNN